ncbi:plasmid pRiA4b ORF-3 family protein [Schleiferilactobacillus harbinensis]|uniref:plasmid pRiA4b ORF-3 family protein n=1 Tax=Schleiferilactobacillus harbinensis TaxID=304207 RepID=UPI001168EBF5|nr:plasmid pRiA4b ORF-3 family protein [Schleiferilactobacillus harbinensis]GEK06427.1 hypothetical protein LHA01_16660 [Schleiferilactobacillus harbinensis]
MAQKEYLQLKITLKGFRPPVWRRVVVPATIRLDALHTIIQVLFSWEDAHLHSFNSVKHPDVLFGPKGVGDDVYNGPQPEDQTLARPMLETSDLLYTYDFGDEWDHLIHLEKALTPAELKSKIVPYCVTGRGASRLEDSGMTDSPDSTIPFDRQAINERLAAKFSNPPTPANVVPMKRPDQTVSEKNDRPASDDEIEHSVADFLQSNPQLGQALAENKDLSKADEKTLGDFIMNQVMPQFGDSDQPTTPISDTALKKSLAGIDQADTEKQHDAYNTLMDADLTAKQAQYAAQTVLDNHWLFKDIKQTKGAAADTRTHAADLLADLLDQDDALGAKPVLTSALRTSIFTAATQYARAEKGMTLTWWQTTPLTAALELLRSAVAHDKYPKKMMNDLQETLIAVFNTLSMPLWGQESETVLEMLLEVTDAGKLSKARFKRTISRVTKAVFYDADDAGAVQTLRARSWIQVLMPLCMGLLSQDYDEEIVMDMMEQVSDYYAFHGIMLGDGSPTDYFDDPDEGDY